MQQTEKYKLNLIERSDPFLPDSLNQNTQRVEDVLVEKMEGPVAELDGRVSFLEGRRIAVGVYVGTYNPHDSTTIRDQDIFLGFRPKFGFITNGINFLFHWETCPNPRLTPTDDGFRVEEGWNTINIPYNFLLFG